MMKKDRRIRRTQRLLGEALIELCLEKGYKNITIQEVTERADVGYRTYFRHYASLDELLIDIAKVRLDEVYEYLALPATSQLFNNPLDLMQEIGRKLFQYIQNEPEDLRLLFLDPDLRFVLDPVMERAKMRTEEKLSNLSQKRISAALAANHIVISAYSLLRWWLANDTPQSPDEMGEIFTELTLKPTLSIMLDE